MAKKKKKVIKKTKTKDKGWSNQLLWISALLTAAIFLPSTFLLMVGMLPTPFAVFVDRSRRKNKVVTVGAMNLAGCSPFLFELWTTGHNFDTAISIITDPKAIIVMYSAAAVGYLINWSMTGMVSIVMYQRGVSRQKAIEKRQEDLIERWGREVTGDLQLDKDGFAIEDPVQASSSDEKASNRS